MKILVITPFDNYSYDVRIKYLEKIFKNNGFEWTVLSSNFNHRNKETYIKKRDNLVLIDTPRYKKNISIKRIWSHVIFSKRAYKYYLNNPADIVYVSAPPNFLIKQFSKIKKKRKKSKLIVEIGDMWPETLPIPVSLKKFLSPLLFLWKRCRNNYLKFYDNVIFECDLFKNYFYDKFDLKNVETIYLCKENFLQKSNYSCDLNIVEFCYIGSINNIIEIDLMIKILLIVMKSKKILFNIIGDGEKRYFLEKLCISNKIPYKFYGPIYEDSQKEIILKKCHFGFNLMKDTVCVGLTMKSLEYFHWGIALINNIPYDTSALLEKYNCGFNICNYDDIEDLCKALIALSENEIKRLKENSRLVYNDNFSDEVVMRNLKKLF